MGDVRERPVTWVDVLRGWFADKEYAERVLASGYGRILREAIDAGRMGVPVFPPFAAEDVGEYVRILAEAGLIRAEVTITKNDTTRRSDTR